MFYDNIEIERIFPNKDTIEILKKNGLDTLQKIIEIKDLNLLKIVEDNNLNYKVILSNIFNYIKSNFYKHSNYGERLEEYNKQIFDLRKVLGEQTLVLEQINLFCIQFFNLVNLRTPEILKFSKVIDEFQIRNNKFIEDILYMPKYIPTFEYESQIKEIENFNKLCIKDK